MKKLLIAMSLLMSMMSVQAASKKAASVTRVDPAFGMRA